MNGKDFYNFIRQQYPEKGSVSVGLYVNPLLHYPDHFRSVQFCYPNGYICIPFHPEADNKIVADPLAGPFYELEIIGLIHNEYIMGGKKNQFICTVVRLSPILLISSKPIIIRSIFAASIKEDLSHIACNKWYNNNAGHIEFINNELVCKKEKLV